MPNYLHTDPEYWQGAQYALPGVKSKRWAIGNTSQDDAWAMVLEMESGFVLARHAHNFDRFEVIIKGSLYIGDQVYGPGDIMTARAHEFYGPKVCGPAGCTTMEFFARKQGEEYLEFELADGTTVPYTQDMNAYPDGIVEQEWIERTRARVLAEAAEGQERAGVA